MAARREPWETVFDRVRVIRDPGSVYRPPVLDGDLDRVEVALGSRLPHSYREFMKRFGAGDVNGWLTIQSIFPHKSDGPAPVFEKTEAMRQYFGRSSGERYPNQFWLA